MPGKFVSYGTEKRLDNQVYLSFLLCRQRGLEGLRSRPGKQLRRRVDRPQGSSCVAAESLARHCHLHHR